MKELFSKSARKITEWSGSYWASISSMLLVLLWFLGGIWFGYGTDYQIIINTGTTCITFIMVFLIQHTQNRDSKALQLKVDELIRAKQHADNRLINIEALSDEEFNKIVAERCKKPHDFAGPQPNLYMD